MTSIRFLISIPLLFALCAASAAEAPLATAPAEFRSVVRENAFDGVVEAINRTTVSAETNGRVEEILFDVDDYVTKGTVILRFRDTDQRAGLAQAEATLNETEARFKEADSEYRRVVDLLKKDLAAQSAMDKAEAALKAARARLDAARAGVEQAREQLEHTVVRAPYSGIVTERHVELGEVANPGQPLMSGISLERLRVAAQVPQRLIEAVRLHGKARVEVSRGEADDRTAISIPAEGLTFFPHSDPQTHTFTVRVQLPEGQQGLYPGMFVKALFVTGEVKRLVVPESAVVRRGEVSAVYVVGEDGAPRLRQVRLGRFDDRCGRVVLAGLEEGEPVALDPIRAGVLLKGSKEAP
ncbi:efflux RND transporter periplasmic adaptor subunit [Endothiovibrio diazotrophicus]